jgi:hypothetical protein
LARKPESAEQPKDAFTDAFNTALTDAFGPHQDDKAAAIAADDAARESAEANAKERIEIDKNGVRSHVKKGVRVTEPVAIRPTRGGVVIETPRPTTADDSMQALTNIFRAKAKKPPEGFSTLALKSKILKHWKEWLPKKYARLKKEGILDQEAQSIAVRAQEEMESLRASGYPEFAAEEVVQAWVLEKPQVDGLDEEQREELAEKEREYQKNPPVWSLTHRPQISASQTSWRTLARV